MTFWCGRTVSHIRYCWWTTRSSPLRIGIEFLVLITRKKDFLRTCGGLVRGCCPVNDRRRSQRRWIGRISALFLNPSLVSAFACPISMFRSRGSWDRQSYQWGFEVSGLLVNMIITLAAMAVKDGSGFGAEIDHTQSQGMLCCSGGRIFDAGIDVDAEF